MSEAPSSSALRTGNRGRGPWLARLIVSLVVLATVSAAVVAGCGSEGGSQQRGNGEDTRDATVEDTGPGFGGGTTGSTTGPIILDDSGFATRPDATCTPTITSCVGHCGRTLDPCTGAVYECGGCATGQGCDPETKTCITPKITCGQLGAQCGRARNTCGARLDCGTCPLGDGGPSGMECEDNRCVPCRYDLTKPADVKTACRELDLQCGENWLGCGPATTLHDCGTCPTLDGGIAQTCNTINHHCEPTAGPNCTPKTKAELCELTATKDGVAVAGKRECGLVSDGCGGIVDCEGCPGTLQCGRGGVANMCASVNDNSECAVAGYECGEIDSACGGGKISCGGNNCPPGPDGGIQVCTDGKCGPPCVPALPPDAGAVECGVFNNGCKGTITKACPAYDSGRPGICRGDGTCCEKNACAANTCGSKLGDGCGGNTLDCPCGNNGVSNGVCSSNADGVAGTCCFPESTGLPKYIGKCGYNLDLTCGVTANLPCADGRDACRDGSGNVVADNVLGTCCPPPSCNGVCNTTVVAACGTPRDCSDTSCGSGRRCTRSGGADAGAGTCCSVPSCNGACNTTVTSSEDPVCDRACSCNSNQVCLGNDDAGVADPDGGVAGTCCTKPSCGSGNSQKCNTTVSACGIDLSCGGCPSTHQCVNNTCTRIKNCGDYGSACGKDLDDGVGGNTVNCPCSGGYTCSTNVSGQTGTCSCPNPVKTCADYVAAGDLRCGMNLPNACGGNIQCSCAQLGFDGYQSCGGGGQANRCGCTSDPNFCNGRCGPLLDNCGKPRTCPPC